MASGGSTIIGEGARVTTTDPGLLALAGDVIGKALGAVGNAVQATQAVASGGRVSAPAPSTGGMPRWLVWVMGGTGLLAVIGVVAGFMRGAKA